MQIAPLSREIKVLGNELNNLLKQCKQFNIASAFITREGIDSLEIFLKENRTSNREGRLLIGLFQCFNRKVDLEKLQKMANRNPRLQVNISCDLEFHWKYYSFLLPKRQAVFIGSANFTSKGLDARGEMMIEMSGSYKKSQFRQFDEIFDEAWKNSKAISQIPLAFYQQNSQAVEKSVVRLSQEICDALHSETFESEDRQLTQTKLCITSIKRFLTAHEMKTIEQKESDWVRLGYEYLMWDGKALADRISKYPQFILVTKEGDKCRFELATKKQTKTVFIDGKQCYCTAYVVEKGKTRTMSWENVKKTAEKISSKPIVLKRRSIITKTLGPKQVEDVIQALF